MQWLQRLFDKVMSVFPSCLHVKPYMMGIRYTLGKHVKKLEPGWYMYWPLIQDMGYMEVVTQVVDLRTQSCKTLDGKDVVVSGALQYRITNIEHALLNVQDLDKSLITLALGIILEFVNVKTLEECHNIEELKGDITKGLRDKARGWGVKIENVYITDIGNSRNIRLLTNGEGIV